jgi:hypothetical protein
MIGQHFDAPKMLAKHGGSCSGKRPRSFKVKMEYQHPAFAVPLLRGMLVRRGEITTYFQFIQAKRRTPIVFLVFQGSTGRTDVALEAIWPDYADRIKYQPPRTAAARPKRLCRIGLSLKTIRSEFAVFFPSS